MANTSIVVVGSLNYDLVTSVGVVPHGGETVRANGFDTHFGGKGANQALALRRLSGPNVSVALVGCVGSDVFGTDFLEHLRREGVDSKYVTRLENERTGVATILVEASGENRILVFGGANDQVSSDRIEADLLQSADFICVQNEIPISTTFGVLESARALKARTVFNPSPLPTQPLEEWPHIDVLVVNEGEAEALSRKSVKNREEATSALEVLLGTASMAVITLGATGVVWQERNSEPGFVPAHKVEKVVDTTGAGDTFLAAFVSQLSNANLSLRDCISFAAKAASIAVTRRGAASSVPHLKELSN